MASFPILITSFNNYIIDTWKFFCIRFVNCGFQPFISYWIINWAFYSFATVGFNIHLRFYYIIERGRILLLKVFIKLFRTHCFSSMCFSFSEVKDFSYLSPGLFGVLHIDIRHAFADRLLFLLSTSLFEPLLFVSQ